MAIGRGRDGLAKIAPGCGGQPTSMIATIAMPVTTETIASAIESFRKVSSSTGASIKRFLSHRNGAGVNGAVTYRTADDVAQTFGQLM